MTVRLILVIALGCPAFLAYPQTGFCETRLLSAEGAAPALSDSTRSGPCCTVEGLAPVAGSDVPGGGGLPAQAPAAPDAAPGAGQMRDGDNRTAASATGVVQAASGGSIDAAVVAAPPQSLWRRFWSAILDLGSTITARQ
jgi:hypothetical protein